MNKKSQPKYPRYFVPKDGSSFYWRIDNEDKKCKCISTDDRTEISTILFKQDIEYVLKFLSMREVKEPEIALMFGFVL